MAVLSVKILLIITVLMIFMEILRQFNLIDRMLRVIEPLMGHDRTESGRGHAVADRGSIRNHLWRRRYSRGGQRASIITGTVENTACIHWYQSCHGGRSGPVSAVGHPSLLVVGSTAGNGCRVHRWLPNVAMVAHPRPENDGRRLHRQMVNKGRPMQSPPPPTFPFRPKVPAHCPGGPFWAWSSG